MSMALKAKQISFDELPPRPEPLPATARPGPAPETLSVGKLFDAKRDRVIVAAGGFFCRACLVARPATERSLDKRYCQGCYEFLTAEAELDNGRGRPSWAPVMPQDATPANNSHVEPVTQKHTLSSSGEKPVTAQDATSDTLDAEIRRLAGAGLSSRKIAEALGNKVSYRTVARRLQGELV